MRSVLARKSLIDPTEQPTESWRLRDHAKVLYSIFPANQFLVQSDHFVWIQLEPLDASTTRVRICTLAPADRAVSGADIDRWSKSHEITMATLAEDLDISGSIQAGLDSGANETLRFGRFESALAEFNRVVDEWPWSEGMARADGQAPVYRNKPCPERSYQSSIGVRSFLQLHSTSSMNQV